MSQPTTVRLAKAWGKHKTNAELVVLAPGGSLAPNAIDPQRAAQLARDGFLASAEPAAKKKPAKFEKEA